MITVGSYEAKTRLSALLDKVEQGEKVTITRHGVPVAVMEPVGAPDRAKVRQTIDKIRRHREGKSLGGITIRELIEEGRRY